MRTASHIATALSAATGRSDRPNGGQRIGVCAAYLGFLAVTRDWANEGSRLKPE